MNSIDFLNREIFIRYGNVRRTRGPFLYTEKNVRLTDMYQENGRAILGWGGCNGFTFLKNVLSRGQTGSFVTQHLYQLEKAVSTLLNSSRGIFLFNSLQEAQNCSQKFFSETAVVYRPWIPENEKIYQAAAVIVQPPLAWTQDHFILALQPELLEKKSDVLDSIPCCRTAPCLLQAYARSIYDLIKALQEREEKDWFLYDQALKPYFVRTGPYLKSKVPASVYSDFVKHCLDCGIVINPDSDGLSIVPYSADKGVFEKLKKNPFTFQA